MKRLSILLFVILLVSCQRPASVREEWLLTEWAFSRDSVAWEQVTVPHDWAIYGPFSRDYDLQNVAITQNYAQSDSGEVVPPWRLELSLSNH